MMTQKNEDTLQYTPVNEAPDVLQSVAQALYKNRQKASVKKLLAGKKLSIADWLLIGDLAIEYAKSLGESVSKDTILTRLAESLESEDSNLSEIVVHEGLHLHMETFQLPGAPTWVVPTDIELNESEVSFMYNSVIEVMHITTPDCDIMSKNMTEAEATEYVLGMFENSVDKLTVEELTESGFIPRFIL